MGAAEVRAAVAKFVCIENAFCSNPGRNSAPAPRRLEVASDQKEAHWQQQCWIRI